MLPTVRAVILLSLWTTFPPPLLCFINSSPAEILAPDGMPAFEFAVGSDVKLMCRLYQTEKYDISKMTLVSKSTNQQLNVTVVSDDVIEATLHNVSLKSKEIIQCRQGPHFLALQTVCFGYAPSPVMEIRCQWHPLRTLRCCVNSQQPQNTLCNVKWFMEYCQTGCDNEERWVPFLRNNHEITDFKGTEGCLSRPEKGGNPSIYYYRQLNVRATAVNGIGTERSSFTFIPAHYVVPGAVEKLWVFSRTTDPTSLLITWYHSQYVAYNVCQQMGGFFYNITFTSEQDKSHVVVHEADCQMGAYQQKQSYTMTGLVPYTTYNVTLTPVSTRWTLHGPPRSAHNMTCQSAPLTPPSIMGWSSNSANDRVVIYWKPLHHRYSGGPMTAFNIAVRSQATSDRNDYFFPTGRPAGNVIRKLVTSPRVLPGCSEGCDISMTASTIAGSSPPARISIPVRLKDLKVPVVHVEIARDQGRIVSWEGFFPVMSIVWCYGDYFVSHPSLVMCQTELQEAALKPGATQHVISKAAITHGQHLADSVKMCENCQWHFAVQVSDILADPYRNLSSGTHWNADVGTAKDVDGSRASLGFLRKSGSDSEFEHNVIPDTSSEPNKSSLKAFYNISKANGNARSDADENGIYDIESETDRNARSLLDLHSPDDSDINNAPEMGSASYENIHFDADTETDPGQEMIAANRWFVWHHCQFSVDGESPVPLISVREGREEQILVVQTDSVCQRDGHTARPYLVHLVYGSPLSNCSQHAGSTVNATLQAKDGRTMGGLALTAEFTLTGLTRGKNYTMCARLQSKQGLGKWQRIWYSYKLSELSDNSYKMALLFSMLVISVPLFCFSIRWCVKGVKTRAKKFSPLAKTPEIQQIPLGTSSAPGKVVLSFTSTFADTDTIVAVPEKSSDYERPNVTYTEANKATLTSTKTSFAPRYRTSIELSSSSTNLTEKQESLTSEDSAFVDTLDGTHGHSGSETSQNDELNPDSREYHNHPKEYVKITAPFDQKDYNTENQSNALEYIEKPKLCVVPNCHFRDYQDSVLLHNSEPKTNHGDSDGEEPDASICSSLKQIAITINPDERVPPEGNHPIAVSTQEFDLPYRIVQCNIPTPANPGVSYVCIAPNL